MEALWEVVKYVVPALLVWTAFFYSLRKFFRAEDKRRDFELKKQNSKVATPIRLRAFERLILYLERAKPENIIPKQQSNKMNSMELHAIILKTLRNEFEHNLSQQLYISPKGWQLIKAAKEKLAHLYNSSAAAVDPHSPSIDFGREALSTYHNWTENPVDIAIAHLQLEIKEFL